MCVCARHEMVRPNGVGDLQKGEKYVVYRFQRDKPLTLLYLRYCNIDWILLNALLGLYLLLLILSYDIACQYKINFQKRMLELPSHLQLSESMSIRYGIPKCHCPAHKLECQAPHSLNLMCGVGRTDGEGIERSWSELNGIANSTKEMGPGSRHDTLDDHMGHHNWRKYADLGE